MNNQPQGHKGCRVLAYDKRRQHYLGAVADLGTDRLVLVLDRPLQPEQVLELELRCADEGPGLDGVYIGARVTWSDDHAGIPWAGLKILSVDPLVKQRLAQLKIMAEDEPFESTSLSA